MAQVQIRDLNQGGIADSDYMGNKNSVAEMVGCNIHEESGVIECNQKLTKESGSVVTELIISSVACSNGSTYHFGDEGGMYRRSSLGTWLKEDTVAPAVGAVKILGAAEYQGYIYYATERRLGRWQIGTAWLGGSDDNWAIFDVGDRSFHPMHVVNQVLYIGDGNQVAQVDAGVFSSNALDIEYPLRISALWNIDTDLMIGTYVAQNVLRTQIIRWNTWSVSFSVSDPIPEVGINAFIDADNFVIVSAGTKGNLYTYDGMQLSRYKRIKGDWRLANKAKVNTNAMYNFNGKPLFGLSAIAGDGVKLGVYSIHQTDRNYPYVLNIEHTISTGNMTGIQIGTICPVSADQFVVSWRDDNTSEDGVDILDLTEKQVAYFITRNMIANGTEKDNYKGVYVPYREYPDDSSIKIYVARDHEDFAAEKASRRDSLKKIVETDAAIGEARVLKLKVELTPDTNDSPQIEMAVVKID